MFAFLIYYLVLFDTSSVFAFLPFVAKTLGMQGISLTENDIDPLTGSLMANKSPDLLRLEQMMIEEKLSKLTCDQMKGLSKGQMQLCHLYKDHMPHIGKGARLGITECQWQFKNSRWNCSIDDSTVFGSILTKASREAAFAHAISTAGVVHSIARACRDGQLPNCGCSKASRPRNLKKDWLWGGCGDNIDYGYKFSETFIDLKEKEKSSLKSLKDKGRRLMNLHNNEVGRRAVIRKTRVTCKCHGVSGSCSLITCWQQLSSFREVGDYLKDKYEKSTEVKINKRGKLQVRNKRQKLPTAEDLVHVDSSPDFCMDKGGTFGTQGRVCNRTSRGSDGCESMCCGRGYDTHTAMVDERCRCRFHWCCYVQCDTCQIQREIHTCK
ncbi:protein Wnt-5b [Tetranychus urticae]|uniref:protein Wnt-5b n=1 Tax=Tetranychus urticae TaxID=32264 RepID=UPI00077BE4A2|nr:protein Wnt-5b [Tetranychus urticae]